MNMRPPPNYRSSGAPDLASRNIEIFLILLAAESLESLCKKKVKKLFNNEDLEKLFLPKLMVEEIRQMTKPGS